MPIALANTGWKVYMSNSACDIVTLAAIIYYRVETKGKTLAEIETVLEGKKHSDVPDLEMVYKGKEDIRERPTAEVNEVKN